MTEKKWNDDVMKGIAYTHNLLDFILSERSQLYGTLVHFMVQFEVNNIEFPTPEDLAFYGKNYYIHFDTDDNKIKLMKQENTDGNQDAG